MALLVFGRVGPHLPVFTRADGQAAPGQVTFRLDEMPPRDVDGASTSPLDPNTSLEEDGVRVMHVAVDTQWRCVTTR
jgi:hypothetical protein